MGSRAAFVVMIGLGLAAGAAWAEAPLRNGFSLADALVPAEEILAGGPPRDGIPALDRPALAPADALPWSDDVIVLGVAWQGQARAYPLPLLAWHELVNDRLGDKTILVSYCPLCGTGMVFERSGPDDGFGVSGLLYRSDMLMYDRATESLWSQIEARAVTGPRRGERLPLLRSRMMSLGAWRRLHPQSEVVGRDTGHRRDYGRSPYGDYARDDRLFFPVPLDRRYHPKMPTVGLRVAGGGSARAYPALELARHGGAVEERFAGQAVRVAYDAERQVFEVEAPVGIDVVEGFWFAWAAFHPETSVFQATVPQPERESALEPKEDDR